MRPRRFRVRSHAENIELSIIGCGALRLQADYRRGTKDRDVFETTSLTRDIQVRLLAIAGVDTEIHTRHRMYVDIVKNGIPFLPRHPRWHQVHGELLGRFRSAYEEFSFDARAAHLPAYVDHLHEVERDMLEVDETAFDLEALHD